MNIKAILKNGQIQLLEPLPSDWEEGQELVVEPPPTAIDASELAVWNADLQKSIEAIPEEDHRHFLEALEDIEIESKKQVRQAWGLS